MYYTDEAFQQEQKERARAAIAHIAERHKFRKRRLAELHFRRGIYEGYGQIAAVNVMEEQMIIWGIKEQNRNRELFLIYDAELKKRVIPFDKEEWDEADHQLFGVVVAYSEARYAVRFMEVMAAIEYLSTWRESVVDRLENPHCYSHEACKGRAAIAVINTVIDQLACRMKQMMISKMIRYYVEQHGETRWSSRLP